VALDLGNLLAQLGGQYIDSRWGTPAPSGYSSVANVPMGGANGVGTVPSGLAQDMFCPNEDDARLGKLESCRVDPCTGLVTLVKRTRRRRKRLATASDIRDINALMGAFAVSSSQPRSLTAWIASRGR